MGNLCSADSTPNGATVAMNTHNSDRTNLVNKGSKQTNSICDSSALLTKYRPQSSALCHQITIDATVSVTFTYSSETSQSSDEKSPEKNISTLRKNQTIQSTSSIMSIPVEVFNSNSSASCLINLKQVKKLGSKIHGMKASVNSAMSD